MTKQNIILLAAACFIVGGFVGSSFDRGYGRGGVCPIARGGSYTESGYPMMDDDDIPMGMHRMADGSMMNNSGMEGSMGSMMMDMTARLQGKTGNALDKIFLEDMIVHHQGAVDMAELLAAGSQRPEMQKFAADIIRVQSAEIEQMKAWKTSWFGN